MDRRERDKAAREEPGKERPKKRKSRLFVWAKRALLALLALFAAGCFGLWLLLRHYEKDLPSLDEIQHYDPPQVTRILARDGTQLAEIFIERRTVVPIEQVPQSLKLAVLAAEDAEFYEHDGLDYLGMLRALWVNIRSGSTRQGGSTITQQVVKNLLLTNERTFARKCKEVLLARRIEQELSKDQILGLYLNHIFLGHGRYGVEEASRYYFGKGVSDLSLAESALIAGLPKGPSYYSPRVDAERSRRRRDWVLDQMVEKRFATVELAAQAKRQPVVLAPAVETMSELAPEVVDEVERILHARLGDEMKHGGYTVTTTIDTAFQSAARAAVRQNLDAFAERHKLLPPIAKPSKKPKKGDPTPFQGTPDAKGHKIFWAVVAGADDAAGTLAVRVGTADGVVELGSARRYNPKGLPPSRFAEVGALLRVSAIVERGVGPDGVPSRFRLELGPESALVAIEPATGEVLAMVGSYEGVRGGLDRATFAHRQPGSSFKPFVYATALAEHKLTPASFIELPATPTQHGAAPAPGKLLRARVALAQSVNDAAVWALHRAGPANVIALARGFGIESRLEPTDSLALGAYEVTPRELAGAYAALAAGGVVRPAVLVSKIVGPDGSQMPLPATAGEHRALGADVTYVLTSLLTSVVQEGTGRRARDLGRPVAGKTGTSNDAKDAWFAGFTPDLACVVWTGFDDAAPLGRGESGAVSSLPAFVSFMRDAHRGMPTHPFTEPPGVVHVRIDPDTGLVAYEGQKNALDEVFLPGTQPTVELETVDTGAGGAPPAAPSRTSPVVPDEPAGDEPIESPPPDEPSPAAPEVVELPPHDPIGDAIATARPGD